MELQIIKESFIQLFEGALKRVSQRLVIRLAVNRCYRLPGLFAELAQAGGPFSGLVHAAT